MCITLSKTWTSIRSLKSQKRILACTGNILHFRRSLWWLGLVRTLRTAVALGCAPRRWLPPLPCPSQSCYPGMPRAAPSPRVPSGPRHPLSLAIRATPGPQIDSGGGNGSAQTALWQLRITFQVCAHDCWLQNSIPQKMLIWCKSSCHRLCSFSFEHQILNARNIVDWFHSMLF